MDLGVENQLMRQFVTNLVYVEFGKKKFALINIMVFVIITDYIDSLQLPFYYHTQCQSYVEGHTLDIIYVP